MSLVQRSLFFVSVPTLAVLVSILWLRHRRRGRRLHADPGGGPQDTTKSQEEPQLYLGLRGGSTSHIEIKDENIQEILDSLDEEEEDIGVLELTQSSEDLEEDNRSIVSEEVQEIQSAAFVESQPELAEDICQESAESGGNTVEISIIVEEKVEETVVKELPPQQEETVKESVESDLEEGEIRSDTEDTEKDNIKMAEGDRKEVVAAASLPQSQPPKVVSNDLEEGEIRSDSESSGGACGTLMKEMASTSKLASLELDQMKMSTDALRKESCERDSANHSPSEVMLASPSISNFSDAHSEVEKSHEKNMPQSLLVKHQEDGSSDSGKGHSDENISPSRSPVGGSSLAGDHIYQLYEFVIPQNIVGRLIGRHGSFLQEIRAETHTHVYIKKHPETKTKKICQIEGTQANIDKALAKIRNKFPAHKYADLTMERVSFVCLGSVPPLPQPEDYFLSLVEGVNNDVIISSLISPSHLFLQQPYHPSYRHLRTLTDLMNSCYGFPDQAPRVDNPQKDQVVVAPALGGWYRAQVTTVDNDLCTVRFVDFGGFSQLKIAELRQIHLDLMANMPFQAVECYLAYVKPLGGEWTEEARQFVEFLTCGQILSAQVVGYSAEDGKPFVSIYAKQFNKVLLVNEELCNTGHAEFVPPELHNMVISVCTEYVPETIKTTNIEEVQPPLTTVVEKEEEDSGMMDGSTPSEVSEEKEEVEVEDAGRRSSTGSSSTKEGVTEADGLGKEEEATSRSSRRQEKRKRKKKTTIVTHH